MQKHDRKMAKINGWGGRGRGVKTILYWQSIKSSSIIRFITLGKASNTTRNI